VVLVFAPISVVFPATALELRRKISRREKLEPPSSRGPGLEAGRALPGRNVFISEWGAGGL
jgi:hypothetical protein